MSTLDEHGADGNGDGLELDDELEHEHDDEHGDDEHDLEAIAEHESQAERALQEAHGTYLRAVQDHFGADAPVWPCPTCSSRGYVTMQLQADPDVHRCDVCQGVGVTATGSLVDGNVTRPCPKCRGAGFVAVIAEGLPASAEPPSPAVHILPPSAFPPPPPIPLEAPVPAA